MSQDEKTHGDAHRKPQWHLMPFDVLVDCLAAFEHGARKYSPENWRNADDVDMYFSACMRHMIAWKQGEKIDPESGNYHIGHALACLLILQWVDVHKDVNDWTEIVSEEKEEEEEEQLNLFGNVANAYSKLIAEHFNGEVLRGRAEDDPYNTQGFGNVPFRGVVE